MSQCLDSPLQFVLILRVNAASCLVQNDNRRIFQHGTGDGNTLALPTGKVGTGAADNRIIAIVQPADKGVATTLFGGLFHLRVCGAGSSHADILPDTAVKQVVVLRYIGNLICNFRQRYILQLMTAEGNAAGCNIPISGNQLCHRRFAGARRPHKGGHGAGPDGQAHTMQNLCCPVIGKRHRPKRNAGIFQLDRRILMVQFFSVQKLADFFHICP